MSIYGMLSFVLSLTFVWKYLFAHPKSPMCAKAHHTNHLLGFLSFIWFFSCCWWCLLFGCFTHNNEDQQYNQSQDSTNNENDLLIIGHWFYLVTDETIPVTKSKLDSRNSITYPTTYTLLTSGGTNSGLVCLA